jgi:23S rRNA (pseudouridine1915-N3)-methyltransferase
MKLRVLSVGKPRDPEACAMYDRYGDRIVRFGVGFESIWVPEVKSGGRYSDDHVREREARLLIDRLAGQGHVIAVDPGGRGHTSEQLARHLARWAEPAATFVIGGPLGLHETLLSRADAAWSLSSLTLPHELARVLVGEQLYRGLTILRGVPYHK